ncbi:unnamed protein product [Discosporangium mesarthrocarpum]|jgi:microsomal dipeptidase-like Zn-dependent dipeptidase
MNPTAVLRFFFPLVLAAVIAACGDTETTTPAPAETPAAPPPAPTELSEAELIEQARAIHNRVITLDTHADINTDNFTVEQNYSDNLDTQVTLPKMRDGGLDAAWFVVYTSQGDLNEQGYIEAYANAIDKFEAIHRLTEQLAPEQIELAYTSDDVRRIAGEDKLVAMIGIENAYPIGEDLARIEEFHDRGGRYMSLAHNGHNQLSDSHTGEDTGDFLHGGLSEMGREAIAEMNRLGIMIDISHPSRDAIHEMLDLTQAPVIASHSSARALTNHTRNLDDETLLRVRDNGGVVQAVAFHTYIDEERRVFIAEAQANLREIIAEELGYELLEPDQVAALGPDAQAEYEAQMQEINSQLFPRMAAEVNDNAPVATVADFVDHIDYMVELIGLEHVGISSDFDGGGGIEGWRDASETFNVTLELVRRGYTEEEISALWSGNLLRVLDEVQAVAAGN